MYYIHELLAGRHTRISQRNIFFCRYFFFSFLLYQCVGSTGLLRVESVEPGMKLYCTNERASVFQFLCHGKWHILVRLTIVPVLHREQFRPTKVMGTPLCHFTISAGMSSMYANGKSSTENIIRCVGGPSIVHRIRF